MRVFITGGSGFIGTNLIGTLRERGAEVCNLDLHPPLNPEQEACWQPGDIMDHAGLEKAMADFRPDVVIHLAARTDCDESVTVEEGFALNLQGTEKVLKAVITCGTVKRLIVTSTQFVCGPGYLPKDEHDYAPHTVYGQSKVETEKITRRMDPPCTWTLVRPVNIWGPWHMRYRREFWRVLRKGYYIHPGSAPVIRTYGYVGNLVHQLLTLLEQAEDAVHRKVFYLGDAPADLRSWVDAFSNALTGKPVRVVPRWLVRGAAEFGQAASWLGIPFPITRSRYRSMTTGYPANTQATLDALGPPPYSLEEGVAQTVAWLDSEAADIAAAKDHPMNKP